LTCAIIDLYVSNRGSPGLLQSCSANAAAAAADDDDDDDEHVDGVRLCLWTAATNGPTVHYPGDIWAWRTMVEWWCRQRKTPDSSTRALWQSYQQRHLVASRRNGWKEWEFSLV